MANTSTTNQKQDSCTEVSLSCDHLWSMAQQFAYARLCNKKEGNKIVLSRIYNTRAKRIAATYARFYLETEVGGNPKLKGRYYWMALGAFASKTVACSLNDPRVAAIQTVFEGLGKGNFWLFMDVACWHWYWSNYPRSFNVCATKRDAEQCVPQVKAVLDKLPWATEALKAVQRFKYNDNIKEGMLKVQEFEQTVSRTERPTIQFEHLMAVANHEQGNVLQPLIYEDKDFAKWVGRQRRPGLKQISPTLRLVFSHACSTDDSRLESVAPDDTILENFKSRMDWIKNAAKQFHDLMQGTKQEIDKVYMEQELKTIASWVNHKDLFE
ncbi:MAG: hypothetical protein LBV35_12210 [Acinetobacter sp.]|jgi:hypothetical protein|uniref:DUF2515 family protein n=1 Tax=Acinetobacter TaxID=469 RepID=UPI0020762902|nr:MULTISPECIES: hypothetical protein [Acinetobacter]MDR3029204.1 hypothetical protein [Acinetobacter sp.]